jgi:hypothetical protein
MITLMTIPSHPIVSGDGSADNQLSDAAWVLQKVFGEAFKFQAVEEDASTCDQSVPVPGRLDEKPLGEAAQDKQTNIEDKEPILVASTVTEMDMESTPTHEEGRSCSNSADYYYSFLCLTCAQKCIDLDSDSEDEAE